MSIGIIVQKVGKRWFHCIGKTDDFMVEVEATYSNGFNYVVNDKKSIEAGYRVYDWIPVIKWNLTGKGSRRYREEIIAELNSKLEVAS